MAATTLSPAAAVPTATARSHWHPSTASTAADQCRRRRLGALSAATAMAQHRRPQINADGDGSEPSRHSVDGRRSVPQATARSPLSGDGDGAEPTCHRPTASTATLPPQTSSHDGRRRLRALLPQRRQRRALSGPPAAASCHATKQPEYYYGIMATCSTAGTMRQRKSSLSRGPSALPLSWHVFREVLPTIHPVHVRWFLDLETRVSLCQVGIDSFVHGREIRIRYNRSGTVPANEPNNIFCCCFIRKVSLVKYQAKIFFIFQKFS